MNVFFGISASSGIGTGKAFVIPEQEQRTIPRKGIKPEAVEKEWNRFIKARDSVSQEIQKNLEKINSSKEIDKVQQEIFETYALMLTDPVFMDELKKYLETSLLNVEFVLNFKAEEYADRLRNSGNDYLAERGRDICDIFGRVLNVLLNIHPFNIEDVPENSVIVATALNPSDTLVLSHKKIAGLALTEGGISSHVAILARNYRIPAIFSLPKVTHHVNTGDTVIIDARNAEFIICPDDNVIQDYSVKIAEEEEHARALSMFREKPAQTKDGVRLSILANIGIPEEAQLALEEGADGIGLFRTEFLFMSEALKGNIHINKAASEDIQFRAYKQVLETMGDRPVTIRTLDAGGDKIIKAVDVPGEAEKNPLMGLRAIRLSLHVPQLLKTQLRALYRASAYGNLKIMLPLITDKEQVLQTRSIADEVMKELSVEGIPYNKNVPIGIMVETAAAAITADCLAKVSDFFSIGTNDLTQYIIGVDRENSSVTPLYNEFHLAVLRMIQNTIDAAEAEGIPVSVCGEMASRLDSASILAGMGIRTLSMSGSQISAVKEMLSKITVNELRAISAKSLNNL